MSDESVLDRYTNKLNAAESTADDGMDDLGAFGWLRGIRDRAIMLEFRHKDGSVTAFGYAWLKKATYNPSEGIVLDFAGETVRITGRNLDAELRPRVRLLNGIVRHRVTWIQETDGSHAMMAEKAATVVEHIRVP